MPQPSETHSCLVLRCIDLRDVCYILDAHPTQPQLVFVCTWLCCLLFQSPRKLQARLTWFSLLCGFGRLKTSRDADCAWTLADTEGAVHGVVPQPPVRRGGAQPLLPLIHRHINAAFLAESRRPPRQPLAGDRGKPRRFEKLRSSRNVAPPNQL